jgi:hypothetical protein
MIALTIILFALSIGAILFGTYSKLNLKNTEFINGLPLDNWVYVVLGIIGVIGSLFIAIKLL